MLVKTIYKVGIGIILVSGLTVSCNSKNNTSRISGMNPDKTETTDDFDFQSQQKDLKNQAQIVISEFNKKAQEIKVDAYKNGESLNDDVKRILINTEEQVNQIQEKIDDLNNQSEETWLEYSKSLHQELENIRKNTENLSVKNVG